MNHSYLGIDIIEIGRIKRAVARWNGRFLSRIYTETEIARYVNRPASLAARFAAKEAVIKALNPSNHRISWKEIEVLTESGGKPSVNLYGHAKTLALELGLSGFEISLTHSKELAVAIVLGIDKA